MWCLPGLVLTNSLMPRLFRIWRHLDNKVYEYLICIFYSLTISNYKQYILVISTPTPSPPSDTYKISPLPVLSLSVSVCYRVQTVMPMGISTNIIGLILCRWAGSHSSIEVLRTLVVLYPEDTTSQHPPHPLALMCFFPAPFSLMFPKHCVCVCGGGS